ncbi:MAG: hypothetical protein LC122_09335 [Chitinophagales bacterium]|nr:hypothetical protein [Chitinophagales bacterium]
MKKLLCFCISIFILFTTSAQIGKKIDKKENSIIGTWIYNDKSMNLTLVLQDNGIGEFDGASIKYKIVSNKLLITEDGYTETYTFKLNNDELILSGGDLDNTIVFKRLGSVTENNNKNISSTNATKANKNPLLGTWVYENDEITFMDNGKMIMAGYNVNYTYTNNTITVEIPQSSNITFTYRMSNGNLIINNNGVEYTYTKKGAINNSASNKTIAGNIDKSMVGKWIRMGATGGGYNSTTSSTYEEWFVLQANGRYEYYSELSRGVNTPDIYGGTASTGYEKGSWSVKGNILIVKSDNGKVAQYNFQKRNNKNNDPCLVINGTEYVTAYSKSPW